MEELIFDRTQKDITDKTKKSYYNFDDLNRIEQWCEHVAKLLNSYAYFVDIKIKKDWTMLDFPRQSEMERIRQNINRLKEAYYSFTQIPANLEKMTWQKANDIEKILFEIDTLLNNMISQFYYCGEVYAGEV